MKPTIYASKVDATFGADEIILDCILPGSEGCRVVLSYTTAGKLAALLRAGIKEQKEENEPLVEGT